MNRVVLLVLILLITIGILYYLKGSSLEGFNGTGPPLLGKFLQQNQPAYNDLSVLINPLNPQVPLSPNTTTQFVQATLSNDYASSTIPGTTQPLLIPSTQPSSITVAQSICEKTNTANCNAFNNSEFAANCGIALDIGTNSTGKPHTGGLYLAPTMRASQKDPAQVINGNDYTVYTPTLGTSSMFSTDKKSCLRMTVEQSCKTTKVIGQGNDAASCSLCFTDGSYHAVAKGNPLVPVSLTLISNFNTGDMKVTIGTKVISVSREGSTAALDATGQSYYTYKVPNLQPKEGDTITIYVPPKPNDTSVYIAGYLQAPTANGSYKVDIMSFITKDNNTDPLMNGTINNYFKFNQQPTFKNLTLTGMIPFTFTIPPSHDATNCTNGPFVTQTASMTALNADGDCYNSANSPGNYPIACLQRIFKGVGGTNKGKGYPVDKTTADVLLKDSKGANRSLEQIASYLSEQALRAATGLSNGQSLNVNDWNISSMFMTGTAVTNPCDGGSNFTGPLTTECINFLYTDSETYGNSVNNSQSLTTSGNTPQICTPNGALSPSKPAGLQKAKSAGSKNNVINLYKTAFQTANNTALSDASRKDALNDCYGATVLQPNAEVYVVSKGPTINYTISYDEGPGICARLGGKLATLAQLNEAQVAGSQTCACGFIADDQNPRYPMSQDLGRIAGIWGCGSPGVNDCGGWFKSENRTKAAIYCYGPKPDKSSVPSDLTVGPFVVDIGPKAAPMRWNQSV